MPGKEVEVYTKSTDGSGPVLVNCLEDEQAFFESHGGIKRGEYNAGETEYIMQMNIAAVLDILKKDGWTVVDSGPAKFYMVGWENYWTLRK